MRFSALIMLLVSLALASACKLKSGEDVAFLKDTGEDSPGSYTGHANYRLLLGARSGSDFDPNRNLLRASPAEERTEKIGEAMRSAVLKSLVPVMSSITGHATGTETNLVDLLKTVAGNAQASLKGELEQITGGSSNDGPSISEAWLIPWLQPRQDLFYDQEKISMSSVQVANFLKVVPGSEGFPKKITSDIKELRTKLYRESQDPVFLLAARYFLFVAPQKSQLTIRVLVGVRPLDAPFVKEDPKVKFSKMVIPDPNQEGVTAALTFNIPLAGGDDPTLHIAFGEFKSLDRGVFTMEPNSRQKSAPRLEAQVNKTGASWVALNFAFKEITMNLQTAQLQDLSTLVSPGMRLKGTNWTLGGLNVQSIDTTFQDEINNTIDAEIQSAISRGNDKILDGMLSKAIMDELFKRIFSRGASA